MYSIASLSTRALRLLVERVLRTNRCLGQCLECETANEDMHPTSCKTGAAVLEARFALVKAGLSDDAHLKDKGYEV